ncbi:MAG: hypothetical protein LQ345_000114 [Seirophora villosa]|nr:MAG: hypothetical protein LQ345_000114 [Seirophora villosa]
MTEKIIHTGACHCQSVKFSILAPRDVEICECNCSMCSMRGSLGLEIPAPSLKLLSGKENLSEYRFNTGTAKHWFCRTCGICPLYVPRSNPDGYSINWRCLKKETFTSHKIVSVDGQNWEAIFPEK